MPRTSNKKQILDNLLEVAVEDLLENQSDDDAVSEILEDLCENIEVVSSCRRGILHSISKSTVWRNDILTSLDDDRFKQMLRVNRIQFDLMKSIIENDRSFKCRHSSKQFSIELQLAIVLYRLGENASIKKIANNFGIGDGGTISKITSRIFRAFLKLTEDVIRWPSKEERKIIVSETFDELPFCIGYIDGTEIKLAEAPMNNHTDYFSRNRIYAIKAQVVCDHKRKIRNVVVGSYGKDHDSKIYRNSKIFKEKTKFFSSHQWIAGDSAYPLSEFLITPYRTCSKQMNREARIAFNKRHSKYRVRIEHIFGQLKERFGGLKELKLRVQDSKSHKRCCDWFLVCCIIHNLLITDDNNEDNDVVAQNQTDNCGDEILSIKEDKKGEIKRQALYSMMFE